MPAMPDAADLKQIAVFQGLPPEQWQWLNRRLRLRTIPARQHFIREGEPGDILYIVVAGTVKIYNQHVAGRQATLAILGPGETVGEMSLLTGQDRSASGMTLERTSFLCLNGDDFRHSLQRMPLLSYKLLKMAYLRLRLFHIHIRSLVTLTIDGRLACQILDFADRYGQPTGAGDLLIPLRLTQSDLADLVGASRERVNKVITTYKQRRYLSISRTYRLTVHDREALAQRCG